MNTRTYIVGRAEAGRTVADWLRDRLSLPPGEVRRLLRERRVYLGGAPCLDASRRLQRGQRLEVRGPSVSKKTTPGANASGSPAAKPVLVYADEHVVVADKPPGLTTMRHAEDVAEFGARARRFLPPTLADLLPGLLPKNSGGRPTAVHRLDNETSGLVVFARNAEAERRLGRQFRGHTTDRLYLALVRGRAKAGRIETVLVRDRGDGRRGQHDRPRRRRPEGRDPCSSGGGTR